MSHIPCARTHARRHNKTFPLVVVESKTKQIPQMIEIIILLVGFFCIIRKRKKSEINHEYFRIRRLPIESIQMIFSMRASFLPGYSFDW